MRMFDELWPMMLSYLVLATQYTEAKRAEGNELPPRPSFKQLPECSYRGEKPDFRKTYSCVLDEGESITRVVDGEKVFFKKFCRVRSEGLNENRFAGRLDAATSLVMALAKASGVSKTHDELSKHIESAKANIWIETLGGELISHSAFYADTEPDATCAVGTSGSLAIAPAWQGKRLAKETWDLLADIAYDLGYLAFHTTTKVTNLESLRTQRPTTPGVRLKGMGTIIGYLKAQEDLSEVQPKDTTFVVLMSPTGGLHSCVHNRLRKKFVQQCGPVVMRRYLKSGKHKQVDFTKADMLRQLELDPQTPERALRVLTSSLIKHNQVNFTKADMLRQVERDPQTPERALRVLTSSLNRVLDL